MDITKLKEIIGNIPADIKFCNLTYPNQREWDNEPWYIEWEVNNIKCVIHRRIDAGFLYGYIGLPKNHAYFGLNSEEFPIEVDGGWNYAENEAYFKQGNFDYWWLGFDCNHGDDVNPSQTYNSPSATYKTVYYVAEQLMEIVKELTPEKVREREINHLTSRKQWLETELAKVNLKLFSYQN